MQNKSAGFSSKEFIVVIFIISALCVVSVPIFHELQAKHHDKIVQSLAEQLLQRVKDYKQENTPTAASLQTLDNEPINHVCEACFNIVLPTGGMNDHHWFKLSSNEYLYFNKNVANTKDISKIPSLYKLTFDPANTAITVSRSQLSQ